VKVRVKLYVSKPVDDDDEKGGIKVLSQIVCRGGCCVSCISQKGTT
jgi:hypothetical protein